MNSDSDSEWDYGPLQELAPLTYSEFVEFQRKLSLVYHEAARRYADARGVPNLEEGRFELGEFHHTLSQKVFLDSANIEDENGRLCPRDSDLLKTHQKCEYLAHVCDFLLRSHPKFGIFEAVPAHPDHLLASFHAPDGCKQAPLSIDVDDFDEAEFDRDGSRRRAFLENFHVELSEQSLQKLRCGKLDPSKLWELDASYRARSRASSSDESVAARLQPVAIVPESHADQGDSDLSYEGDPLVQQSEGLFVQQEGYGEYGGEGVDHWQDDVSAPDPGRDLGIGTSRNPPPPVEATAIPPRKRLRGEGPQVAAKPLDRELGKGKGKQRLEDDDAEKMRLADIDHPVVWTDDEGPAEMAYIPSIRMGKKRARPPAVRRFKARTSMPRVQVKRAENRFSEDRLSEIFPGGDDMASIARSIRPRRRDRSASERAKGGGDKAGGERRDYLLHAFRALRTERRVADGVARYRISKESIDLLDVVLRDRRDFVLIGRAAPDFSPEDLDRGLAEQELGEGTMPTATTIEEREIEVHLYPHEIRSVKMTGAGIVVVTATRKFRLTTPAKLPYRRSDQAGIPYEPEVEIGRRVFNVYLLARHHAVRGNYLKPNASQESLLAEASELYKTLEDLIACSPPVAVPDWQRPLPPYWRVPLGELQLQDEAERFALFRLLPNIPFLLPEIYRRVDPYFSTNSFRTDDPKDQKQKMAHESRNVEALLAECHQIVADDRDATDDNEAELVGSPIGTRRDSACNELYGAVRVDAVEYRPGDVVLLRPNRALLCNVSAENLASSDSEDTDVSEKIETRSSEASADLWMGKIQYVLAEDPDPTPGEAADGPAVHVIWLAQAHGVPSVGTHLTGRHLVLLDLCDDQPATAILGKVDCSFPPLGEKQPDRGFYCFFQYNDEDGAFSDVASTTPTPLCDDEGYPPCSSCESSFAYVRNTGDSRTFGVVKAPERKPAVAVWNDEAKVFTLNDVVYHIKDCVYLLPAEPDRVEPPAVAPYDLAQIVGIDETRTAKEGKLHVQVRRILRHASAPLYSQRQVRVSENGEIVSRSAVDVAGRFDLHPIKSASLEADVAKIEQGSLDAFWTTDDFLGCAVCTRAADERQKAKVDIAVAMESPASRPNSGQSRKALELSHLAVYAGGGLLDYGLQQGCPVLRTSDAVEQHAPAAACMRSNFLEDVRTHEESASDVVESLYYELVGGVAGGSETEYPRPGTIFSLAGGSPCQGFSHANRYKQVDDPRTFEPFVFLDFVAVYRPLVGLFENVAAFTRHALPNENQPGSFFALFLSVLLDLGYQVRWRVVDAAGFGVPQQRRRVIVQFAARGFPLASAPEPTHAILRSVQQYDHRLNDNKLGQRPFVDKRVWAAHAPVSVEQAWSDLPSFSVADLAENDRTFGIRWSHSDPASYGRTAASTFQRTARLHVPANPEQGIIYNSGVTHHVCRSLPQDHVERIKNLKLRDDAKGTGNWTDLLGLPCCPALPPWVEQKEIKQRQFWRRLLPGSVLSPLRTTLNIDGASHGERIHWSQARPVSLRELLRAQGMPDFFEPIFSSGLGDDDFDEALRVIGNGVPVPLAAAYGRAIFDALLDIATAHTGLSDVWSNLWRKLYVDYVRPNSPSSPPSAASAPRSVRPQSSILASPATTSSLWTSATNSSTPFSTGAWEKGGRQRDSTGGSSGLSSRAAARDAKEREGRDAADEADIEEENEVSELLLGPTSGSSSTRPAAAATTWPTASRNLPTPRRIDLDLSLCDSDSD